MGYFDEYENGAKNSRAMQDAWDETVNTFTVKALPLAIDVLKDFARKPHGAPPVSPWQEKEICIYREKRRGGLLERRHTVLEPTSEVLRVLYIDGLYESSTGRYIIFDPSQRHFLKLTSATDYVPDPSVLRVVSYEIEPFEEVARVVIASYVDDVLRDRWAESSYNQQDPNKTHSSNVSTEMTLTADSPDSLLTTDGLAKYLVEKLSKYIIVK